MASSNTESAPTQPSANPAAPKALPKRNPVAEMMGLPRFKLPSRNWMIFFSVTGAFFGAVAYDRREKKKNQQKWCDLVSHMAHDPLPGDQMRRKLTIFLSAPPGDGLRTTRDYFRQYVKPVLVAAAIDYDVIEGRKEGDVRYGTAEQIRRLRRKNGENGQNVATDTPDPEQLIALQRQKVGVVEEPGPKGDLVIGRHTWKEYVRGVHEGWLGPLDQPQPEPKEEPIPAPEPAPEPSPETAETTSTETSTDKPEAPAEETKQVDPHAAYIPTSSYQESSLAPTIPAVLEASAPIPQPHILGFLNTPIRIYRYLNQRVLADQIGRETAAVVLGMSAPYKERASSTPAGEDLDASPTQDGASSASQSALEQQDVLAQEESEWHKSVRKPRNDDLERTWLDDVVIDPRIADRMRKFELDPTEEARAERIAQGVEKPLGYREKAEDLKTLVGNLDDPEA